MSGKIRVGIIGCGVIAPSHVESYQALPGVEVTWACDLVAQKAQALADKYGIAHVTDCAAQVLAAADVDLISVCTDHGSHAELVKAAFAAGKHVLCEKALSANLAGLHAMVEAHRAHPQLVFSGVFQHRFDPPMQMLRQLVQGGELGQILTAGVHVFCIRTPAYYNADAWRGTWEHEGGAVLINQAIHFIDSLCFITGGAAAVSGQYANMTHQGVIETEDTAVAALRLRCGGLATIQATCSSHINWENTLFIHGTEGSVELRDGEPLKVLFRDENKAARVRAELAASRESRRIAAGANHYGFGHPAQIADVVAAVREGRAPFVTGESAAHTNELVLSLYQSWNEKRWVELSLPH